jgi:tetrahydromethanopterin S-methyltransferase subunit A
MSKVKFIEVVEQLFASNAVDSEAVAYFEKTIKAKRVNAKDVEKANVIKQAIESVLAKSGKAMDRTEIANIIYDAGEFPEEYLLNDKGTVAYNSITAYANQMVTAGILSKQEVKNGKFKRMVYAIAQ